MKTAAKATVAAIALGLIFPAYLAYLVGVLTCGAPRTFPGWSQAFSLIPGVTGAYLRRDFYRLVLPRCSPGSWISFGSVFSHPTAEVGSNVYVGLYCCLGEVTLEDDVLLGSHISIMNGAAQHGTERLDIPVREQPGQWPHITIGRDTWIGDRAVVMANVGAHCVIGAGSVVTRPVPDYAIAVGVPARVVGYRKGAPVPAGDAVMASPSPGDPMDIK